MGTVTCFIKTVTTPRFYQSTLGPPNHRIQTTGSNLLAGPSPGADGQTALPGGENLEDVAAQRERPVFNIFIDVRPAKQNLLHPT